MNDPIQWSSSSGRGDQQPDSNVDAEADIQFSNAAVSGDIDAPRIVRGPYARPEHAAGGVAIQFTSPVTKHYKPATVNKEVDTLNNLQPFTRIYFYLASVVAPFGVAGILAYGLVMSFLDRAMIFGTSYDWQGAVLVTLVLPALVVSSNGAHWLLTRRLSTDSHLTVSQATVIVGVIAYVVIGLTLVILSMGLILVFAPFGALIMLAVAGLILGFSRLFGRRMNMVQVLGIVTLFSGVTALAAVDGGRVLVGVLGIMLLSVLNSVPFVSLAINCVLLYRLGQERQLRGIAAGRFLTPLVFGILLLVMTVSGFSSWAYLALR